MIRVVRSITESYNFNFVFWTPLEKITWIHTLQEESRCIIQNRKVNPLANKIYEEGKGHA